MSCNQRVKRDAGGKPCYYYITPETSGEAGFCSLPTEFRCIEAVKHYSPRQSFSAVNDWTLCRYKYYLRNIKGIQKHLHMKSDPLKLGGVWDIVWNGMLASGEIILGELLGILRAEAEKIQLSERNIHTLGALIRALDVLGFFPPKASPQVRMQYLIPDKMNLIGYADGVAHPNLFEVKLSSKPDWYTTFFNIHDQMGTYFLADEELKKVVMLVTRVPALKSVKKFEDEDDEGYGLRVHQDIIKRPSHYFEGWDNKTRKFGKVFYRNEFDLVELENKYKMIAVEIPEAVKRGALYQSKQACHSPFRCDYLEVCVSGGVSDTIYEIRQDKGVTK